MGLTYQPCFQDFMQIFRVKYEEKVAPELQTFPIPAKFWIIDIDIIDIFTVIYIILIIIIIQLQRIIYMGLITEFKKFALKGNLVDIAVAFVMGGAFGKVVSTFTEKMVAPIIGVLTGGQNFSDKKLVENFIKILKI